ncbi:MAG TPA: prepilin-type N-terminal cleavage/methylation domain-containing protein [Desulfobulbaceae bacterium]|nr:prepilin-type N-terminal cleavage/methylation domain-containing protein [Desulfobulbaceae bacterium]
MPTLVVFIVRCGWITWSSYAGLSPRFLQQRRKNGFTLMELLVVMVLLSLLTAFAVPKIRTSLFTDQLKATARKLIGLVNETGQQARIEHRPYLLIFDPAARVFTVRAAENKEANTPLSIRPLYLSSGVRVVDFSSVHGGKRDSGELKLMFSKKGYVDKTLIHLQDDSGREMTLALSPFLGVTRLYDSYRTLEQDTFQ